MTALVTSIREEITHALARSHFRDAAEIQHLVLLVLDNLKIENMGRAMERNNVLREVANKLDSIAPRHQVLTPEMAIRLRQRADEVRQMM